MLKAQFLLSRGRIASFIFFIPARIYIDPLILKSSVIVENDGEEFLIAEGASRTFAAIHLREDWLLRGDDSKWHFI
ncbi:unnamed protein product [Allacma fusca]|uniref:Uncharacterized protein n=1 Tax=Allacma fusca TaxID=39272 RepID=A0A8J2MC15_9HEXA|nr:unnamed protein product [Allacma fusca]